MLLLLFVAPIGALVAGAFASQLSWRAQRAASLLGAFVGDNDNRERQWYWAFQGALAACALLCAFLAHFALAEMIQPSRWLSADCLARTRSCFGPDADLQADPLRMLGGTVLLVVTLSACASLLMVMWQRVRVRRACAKSAAETDAALAALRARTSTGTLSPGLIMRLPNARVTRGVSCKKVAAVLGFLAICTLLTAIFSPIWSRLLTGIVFNTGYWFFESPDNVLPASIANVAANFNFKLYADVCVYYVFVGAIAVAAAASHWSPRARRVLRRRVNVACGKGQLGSWFGLFDRGASVAELALLAGVAALFAFWFGYWMFFVRRRLENPANDQSQDSQFGLHVLARALGHMATLAMSLTLYPVARNSVWTAVLGVNYDHAVVFHRFLGGLAYLFTTAHLGVWWLKWAIQGVLWQNLTYLRGVAISDSVLPDPGKQHHFDNFTVALSQISWLFLTGFIIVASVARRQQYELFYYTHHFAIGVLLTALVHAWSFWYFALPPMLLWLLDRALRFKRLTYVRARLHAGASGTFFWQRMRQSEVPANSQSMQ